MRNDTATSYVHQAHHFEIHCYNHYLINWANNEIPDIFFISDRILLLWNGKIGFQGTYEEVSKMKHPMVDEFLHSLEGFQDELTGLLSKQMFRSRYESALTRQVIERTITAVLFSVELDLITEHLGPTAALQVVKSLGEYINKQLDAVGGFSARQSREQILTIIPHAGHGEASAHRRREGRLQQRLLRKVAP